jgi:hypothetical protein
MKGLSAKFQGASLCHQEKAAAQFFARRERISFRALTRGIKDF